MSRKRRPDPKISVAKKTASKWQREQYTVRILRIVIPLAIALVLVLVGVWGYDNYVGAWNQRVATVNETSLDMDYFVKMLRFYRTTSGTDPDPWEVLRAMEEGELVMQEAERLGITVPPEEVTALIAGNFPAESDSIQIIEPDSATVVVGNSTQPAASGNDSSATPGNGTSDVVVIDPEPTSAGDPPAAVGEIGELYDQWLKQLRLSDAEYRRIVETSLLADALEEYMTDNVPNEAEHVHLNLIPLATEAEANDVLDRLQAGEDFGALAGELSILPDTKEANGDVGWVPRGIFPEMDEVAFSLPVGNISDPIATSQAYFIVKVAEKSDSMPVIDEYRTLLGDAEFNGWLQRERQANVLEYLDQSSIEWALDHVV